MGKRGPAPKPSALKVLAGNPGGRRLPAEPEPSPLLQVPPPPVWLDTEAKREWKRVGQELLGLGLLTSLDVVAFAGYCQAFGAYVKANRMLRREGMVIEVNGVKQRNLWAKVAADAFDQMQKGLAQFGLTPSARVRMNPEEKAGEEDELVRMLSRKMGKN